MLQTEAETFSFFKWEYFKESLARMNRFCFVTLTMHTKIRSLHNRWFEIIQWCFGLPSSWSRVKWWSGLWSYRRPKRSIHLRRKFKEARAFFVSAFLLFFYSGWIFFWNGHDRSFRLSTAATYLTVILLFLLLFLFLFLLLLLLLLLPAPGASF